MKKYMVLFGVIFLSSAMASNDQSISLNAERQVNFAERIIVIELVRALSPSVRSSKEKCGEACSDTGALELALGLLGIDRSEASSKALINLLGARLDGGGSEEFSCQILIRGNDVVSRLKNLKPVQVAEHCKKIFYDLKKREIASIADVNVGQVCRSESEINGLRNEFVQAVESHLPCEQ